MRPDFIGRTLWIALLPLGASCGVGSQDAAMAPQAEESVVALGYAAGDELDDGLFATGGGAGARGDYAKKEAKPAPASPGASAERAMEAEPEEPAPEGQTGKDKADRGGDEGGERLRQWFPESFLWQPIVETDDKGVGTVKMRVPDQLTTWRILALAHTKEGAQAGALHTFDSTLPLYVDPVVPGWMYAGDRIELPVQVVNTTDGAVTAQLRVEATGGLEGTAVGSVSLPAGGSDVRKVALSADGSGDSHVRATLQGGDAAERKIPVFPQGRPVQTTRGGTLSSARTFTLAGPKDADPRTQELAVLVFPGPLAVLQAEIERGGAGAMPWDAAYGFALADRMLDLSAQMQVEADPEQIRRTQLLAWQRVVKHGRAPDGGTAADLLAALRGVEGHDLAQDLAKRMARTVADNQRADGTWARQSSASLQQVIVQTAFAGRTLSEDQQGPRLRASGALERHQKDVKDSYTAAVVLASGLVDGDSAGALREIVLEGIVEHEDGRRSVSVPTDAVNVWGWRPSRAEVLAWTTLALADQEALEWRGDLVAELMSGYDARWGFRAGPADVIALEAIATSLPGLDREVEVVMSIDGKEVDRSKLDPSQPKVPAILAAPGSGEVTLKVEPAVPGLAFVATQHSWVPWSGKEALGGVDVEVEAGKLAVGRDGTVTLTLAAPKGVSLAVEQGLPAGATVDEVKLAALGDRLVEWDVTTDRVRVVTRGFGAGEVIEIPIVVRPAFAGKFTTSPLVIEARGGQKAELAPMTWEIAGS